MADNKSTLVVGLGNNYRKDDGVGLYVAEKIRSMNLDNIEVADNIGESTSLIKVWSNAGKVFVVDAVISTEREGTTHRFDALKEKIPGEIFNSYSTHSFSLLESIELAKTLGELPDSLIIYGIEGKDFSSGIGLSSKVIKAADEVIDMLVNEIQSH